MEKVNMEKNRSLHESECDVCDREAKFLQTIVGEGCIGMIQVGISFQGCTVGHLRKSIMDCFKWEEVKEWGEIKSIVWVERSSH